jgi:tetraacyldisaccharide 4'-kinase
MQKLRRLLLPLSWLYGFILFIRNWCYNVGLFKSLPISKKSICIGNLSMGGTGKTPHVMLLANLLKSNYKISILSRGYGRKSKGFLLADENSNFKTIGDEPMTYYQRFKNEVHVAVSEKRAVGVQKIQTLFPDNQVILLDDAFQHRAVKAGRNILLTDYNHLFCDDYVLPAGNLREWKIGRKRADWLIVTKCPKNLSEQEKNNIQKKLKFPADKTYFSTIKYGDLVSFTQINAKDIKHLILVTAIANPTPLVEHLSQKYTLELISFPDHHEFTTADISRIHQKFDTFVQDKKAIITTEKDFVRIAQNETLKDVENYPWYYQEIEVEIDQKEKFNKEIIAYVNTI